MCTSRQAPGRSKLAPREVGKLHRSQQAAPSTSPRSQLTLHTLTTLPVHLKPQTAEPHSTPPACASTTVAAFQKLLTATPKHKMSAPRYTHIISKYLFPFLSLSSLPLPQLSSKPSTLNKTRNRTLDPLFALSIGLTAALVRINREEKEKGKSTTQTIDSLKRRWQLLLGGQRAGASVGGGREG